ncbi:hypothetical protein MMUR_25320 [Mycolicibacterium murale]|jgi:hypothetical protein|uniref:Uncharacterized protein n=2 Tax=Mycolicibacterium murale TaxID=182220 RepID=A0A7I9WM68_9MYCO|nr:hypothetical protein [Mycolicibacterium murale]GFG58396.1 hypothetical protein MMUR_25320 [Mycolicibacterium murale]
MRWTTILIAYPWLALVPAGLLLGLWARSRSRVVLVAAGLWVAYLAWELFVTEGPDANIRLDLLLIYPALLVLTVWALIAGVRLSIGMRRGPTVN